MAAVLHVFHVKKLNTSAYHPQTNGLTERFNHTLCMMLSHYTNGHQNDWDTYLPYALLAYRTTPHNTLKETPFYLLYGRNVRFPFETLIPTVPESDLTLKEDSAAYVNTLVTRLKLAHQVVRDRLLNVHQQRQSDNVQMRQVPQYSVGDKVWLHYPGAVKRGMSKSSRHYGLDRTRLWTAMTIESITKSIHWISLVARSIPPIPSWYM